MILTANVFISEFAGLHRNSILLAAADENINLLSGEAMRYRRGCAVRHAVEVPRAVLLLRGSILWTLQGRSLLKNFAGGPTQENDRIREVADVSEEDGLSCVAGCILFAYASHRPAC